MIHTDGRPTIANRVRRYTEPQHEELWRADQLVRAGVPEELAFDVSSYDYGFVLSLIEAGCDPELAVRIAG